MTASGGRPDYRPWLIISKREAEALLTVARAAIQGTPELVGADLKRAERVMTLQLLYITEGKGHPTDIPDALIRDMRS